ncbi:MAG: hypothetical protein IJ808_00635 [Muribaculaceae bacterium]|nr:hypothetical protein [Muribaculaceae bacterium]
MKKIKYFALCLVALAMMPSCRDNAQGNDDARIDSINMQLNDSLTTALAEKDSLMALMNEISDGMNQIKEMQDIIAVRNLSGETPDRKAQLRNDMALIQQSIGQRKQRLAELEKRLSQSTNYTSEMKKTIESLKQQLENQQKTIDDLTKQLAAAHIEISNLNTRVDSLNTVNTAVNEEKVRAQEESTRLANELNTCYYVIGSKKELKANKIIETGFLRKTKIMERDYEMSYFTKADKRTLSVIPLHSKKAEVMSKHPAGSYEIVDNGGSKTLRIINSTKFWELSNYLIVKID